MRVSPFASRLVRRSSAVAAISAAVAVAAPVVAPSTAAASGWLGPPYLVLWERDGWGLGCNLKTENGIVTFPSGSVVAVDVYAPDGHKIRTDRFKCVNGEWKPL